MKFPDTDVINNVLLIFVSFVLVPTMSLSDGTIAGPLAMWVIIPFSCSHNLWKKWLRRNRRQNNN